MNENDLQLICVPEIQYACCTVILHDHQQLFVLYSQQCNLEAMYAPVSSDVVDSAKEREAWIQNSIDQQRRIVANVRSQPWPMAKKKRALG